MSKFAYAALASAAAVGFFVNSAEAQDAAITSGGDVTADEASVLPPVVVESPSEPIARRRKRAKSVSSASGASGAFAGESAESGTAEPADLEGPTGIYTLGQLDLIGGSTITDEAMYTFNKQSLGQAVNILPGVSWVSTGAPSINSSGARAEGDIFVRGFNRFQVPLYMDGVRVYLPADNRIDMNRFLTPDLSEVQVAKGYVSVLNGPGGEGGAINLVSRKPTKEVELEGRVGAVFDGDLGSMGQWSSYAFGGTRQKGYYAQVSGTIVDQDHFDMSDDFTPAGPGTPGFAGGVANNFPYEDGGNRDNSDFQDWRINAKVGVTPNATDEYSINFTTQAGEKNAPLHVDRQVVQGYFNPGNPGFNGNNVRYWTWPEWDISTLSWLSKTKLGEASYIKSNAYYSTFENTVSFFNNPTYTNQPADSPYDDESVGGFIEMGTDLIPMNTLKGAIHYRKDTHAEQSIFYNYATSPTTVTKGTTKRQAEEGWSFAVENTFHATRNFDIVGGVSYDTNKVLENNNGGIESVVPKPDIDAWNWQAAAIYRYSPSGTVHADVSSRMRFPTLFERYSTRFGNKAPDPNISPERATNYEIGASDTIFPGLHVSSAVFYSDIEDSIQNAFIAANGNNPPNVALVGIAPDGYYYGAEISADYDVNRQLRVGGNYTYIDRDLDYAEAAAGLSGPTITPAIKSAVALNQMEGLPKHKAFFYMAWQATSQLALTPSLEVASDRVALLTSCASTLVAAGGALTPPSGSTGNCLRPSGAQAPNYADIGSYALLNFRADYDFTENFSMAVGVTNLLDQNYALADGFPEPGRQFYATARAKF